MRALSLRLHKQFHQVLPMRAALMAMMRRETHHDGTRLMSGEREVVGYGVNGNPIYIDCVEFPFPAIRYREVTPELCAVREKELGNWNALSLQDNKLLYRHSFCQTYAEIQHFAPDWKLVIGVGLWSAAVGLLISLSYYFKLYDPVPETYAEDRRQSQLRRIIQLQMNPITGLSSKWC